MATLLQLRSQVRSRLGVASTDNFVTDTIIDDHVNIAVQTIEAESAWPWQEVRGDGVIGAAGTMALPMYWSKTRAVLVEERELVYMPPPELELPAREQGMPTAFTIMNKTMRFGPRPPEGTAVVHYYYKTPSFLQTDQQEPEMPARYYPTIVAKAAELMSIREDDRPSAQTHLAEYMQGMARMRTENRTVSRSVGRRIRPGNWV